ncbi:MAG: SGNH/GDSL hydrolase family protein [Clostridiaceae bacterium]|nr:SGNH/GDSL hydrolase family protein [Clostridiaceae bacterium]
MKQNQILDVSIIEVYILIERNGNAVTILVSGDSISKGVIYDESKNKYSILQDNYVDLLRNKLNGIIYNTSRFGNTIIKGIQKLKDSIFKHKPDIVLIEYGGNDCDFNWDEISKDPFADHAPHTGFEKFEKTLFDTVSFIKEKGITPVLMSLPPLNADRYLDWISKNNPIVKTNILKWLGSVTKIYWWQERYNSVIVRIAEETKTLWIDIRSAFLRFPDFSELLCIDGIHPNRNGHAVIAEEIISFVKSDYRHLLI